MRRPVIGLLPLYIELYDLTEPEVRPDIDAFHHLIGQRLEKAGLDVVNVPVCRLSAEFEDAIRTFEEKDCDAVVTLHLAYSPSLESAKPLAETKLPIIIMDTTPDFVYNQHTDISKLMLNHGIHGVQDMCNLLIRNGKKFVIHAGHIDRSNVLDRVARSVGAAMMAKSFRGMRIGRVGETFVGMGDFRVSDVDLKKDFDIEVIQYNFDDGARRMAAVTRAEIDAEYTQNCKVFEIDPNLTREVYDRSARTGLGIRHWLEDERIGAFSINYCETEGNRPGLPIMPFVECSLAMQRGIGYAGEGDLITAALLGMLLAGTRDATFTEMFCPDWANDSVFMSHMGEFNYAVAAEKPLLQEKPFPFTSAENPTVAYQTLRSGRVVDVNLAPFGNGRYTLTLVPGEMLEIKGENNMSGAVNGWFKPDVGLAKCLEEYSKAGATHHSVLVYGDVLEQLKALVEFLPFDLKVIANPSI